MKLNKKILKESMTDTAIAMPIAWILSFLSLYFLIKVGVENVISLSIFQTILLTLASVTRKYLVRDHFSKKTS